MNRGRQKGHGYNRGQGCRRGGNGRWNKNQGHGRPQATNEPRRDANRATASGNCLSGAGHPMAPHGTARQVITERSVGIPQREGTHPVFDDFGPGKQSKTSAPSPEFTVSIDQDLCLGCGMCADVCSASAITMRDGFPIVGEGCIACGLCAQQCPNEAITMAPGKKITSEV